MGSSGSDAELTDGDAELSDDASDEEMAHGFHGVHSDDRPMDIASQALEFVQQGMSQDAAIEKARAMVEGGEDIEISTIKDHMIGLAKPITGDPINRLNNELRYGGGIVGNNQ